MWSILRKVDQKYLDTFEVWCWRMMEKISWNESVRNEEALQRVKEDRNILQLVEALVYKPEGHQFDFRWCHWNFSLTYSFQPNYGPGVDSVSNINGYQEYFLGDKARQCVRMTTLPPSCADCLEIWEPQRPGTLRACPGL
jgi:hypothetical protein